MSLVWAGPKYDPSAPLEGLRAQRPQVDYVVPVNPNEIKIMNYNVLNLFDTEYDPQTKDYTFIPKNHPMKSNCATMNDSNYKRECEETDWTPDRLNLKLEQIAAAVGAQGVLPDIMTMQEVENDNVVGMLAVRLGFKYHVTTRGPDPRGIDVALMFNDTNMKYVDHEELPVSFVDPKHGTKPTRPILVVRFLLPGITKGAKPNILAIYVNHWPSQAAPAEKRNEVARALKNYIQAHRQKYAMANYHVVATGDFNTVDGDHPHPFHSVIEDTSWPDALTDVYRLFKKSGEGIAAQMPLGTYFFMPDYSWQRLDRFFISENLNDAAGVDVIASSYRTVAPEFLTRKKIDDFSTDRHTFGSVIFGTPWRFNYNATSAADAGYSDHFPIVMKIKY